MAKKKSQAEQKALLNSIVADTKGEQGYSLVHPDDVKALVDAGHIEVNPSIKDASGKIAARATTTLLTSHSTNEATASVPGAETIATTATYELEVGIPLSIAKRGGKKDEQYPFSKMEIGQSFFVAATAAYPKPWETFASTVSSATRRFSTASATETKPNRKGVQVPVLTATRKFTLRQVTKGQTYPNSAFVEKDDGARVFRIQ